MSPISGASYFGGGGVLLGVAVLLGWIVLSALTILVLDLRTARTRIGSHV
ncbi:MAG: hypothetical protein ACR2KL_06275 [Nocardioidaceae bacterium]